jgi:1-acyl-sn-glycerol-3-phosphate acyltransferase
MGLIRTLYRWPLFVITIIIGILLTVLFLRGTIPPQGFTSRIITGWLGLAARVFGTRISTTGTPLNGRVLFVANHISWLDILVIGHLVPVHFLSKLEVRHMPLIGWLATRAGTLYIHRGRHESASQATVEITAALKQNHNCLVFAEGGTSDGNLRRFHGRLLQSAIDAHATIQPIAIFFPYRDPDTGQTMLNPATLFIGDISIGESVRQIIRQRSIDVEVHFLEPIECRHRTRDELASHAFEEVEAAFYEIKSRNDQAGRPH